MADTMDMSGSYPEMMQAAMDAQDHPDRNMPDMTVRQQGMDKLKASMNGALDPYGKEFPNSPHYGEAQDSVINASKRFRKK